MSCASLLWRATFPGVRVLFVQAHENGLLYSQGFCELLIKLNIIFFKHKIM